VLNWWVFLELLVQWSKLPGDCLSVLNVHCIHLIKFIYSCHSSKASVRSLHLCLNSERFWVYSTGMFLFSSVFLCCIFVSRWNKDVVLHGNGYSDDCNYHSTHYVHDDDDDYVAFITVNGAASWSSDKILMSDHVHDCCYKLQSVCCVMWMFVLPFPHMIFWPFDWHRYIGPCSNVRYLDHSKNLRLLTYLLTYVLL